MDNPNTPELSKLLEKYSFPVEEVDDSDLVGELELEQPLETIELKAPQSLAYYFSYGHPRFILSYDKGMGKTIAYLASILVDREPGKLIIVCGNNAKLTQLRELRRHFKHLSLTFVEGSKDKRRKAWESEKDVYILTSATLTADMGVRARSTGRIAPSWVDNFQTHMIFDEWHKFLRNKSSGTFKMLKKFPNKRMIFSSGSAGGKGVHSLWPVLHLCDSKKFPAYWPYVMRHANIEETYFGKKVYGCRNVPKWRAEVAPYILHRRKDLKDYPPKTRQLLEVDMEPWQKRLHDQLRSELIAELSDGDYFASSNTLAMLSSLRQFMICPKILDPNFGWGAGLEAVYEDFVESEMGHTVVSVPFVKPIPLLMDFFREKKIPCTALQGGMGHEEIGNTIDYWYRNGGVMIQSIKFAESYELPHARTMYMLGYDHDPEQNMQAEDRIHRDKRVTPHPVDIYYVKCRYSYDADILDALAFHADEVHAMMHRPIKEWVNK